MSPLRFLPTRSRHKATLYRDSNSRGGISPRAIQLMKMMSIPGISANEKEMGGKLLAAELDQSKLPDQVKQYVFAKSQDPTIGSMTDWIRGNKAAGAINIDQRAESGEAKAAGEAAGNKP
jgi:hypothetical protein